MNILETFSNAAADLAQAAAPRLALVRLRHGRRLTATHWRDDLFVVSEQALPARDTFPIFLNGGAEAEATVVGRDNGSNIAVLRTTGAAAAEPPAAGLLRVGGLVVVAGRDREGGVTARLGCVAHIGPAWRSTRGGQIDAFINWMCH